MPDGSPPIKAASDQAPLMLPSDLVEVVAREFGLAYGEPWVVACVCWIQYLRSGRVIDSRAIAEHYTFWCFDSRYYEGFMRLVVRMGLR